jgi:hypothetical protein
MMVYGKEPMIAAQLKRLPSIPEEEEEEDAAPLPHEVQAQLRTRAAALGAAAEKALENLHQAQEQQKRGYRQKRQLKEPETVAEKIPPGSMVLMETPPRSRTKLGAAAEGPDALKEWETRKDGSVTRAVLQDAEGRTWYVAPNRLSLYKPAQPYSEDKNKGDSPPAKRRL